MDALDGCSFIDDLILDLPLDISDQNPKAREQEDEENLETLSKRNSFASKIACNDALDDFCDAADECFPDFLEELEWLTNEDAFPTVETSAISSEKPSVGPKEQSPVSVLECSGVRVPVRARSNRSRRRRRVSCFSGMWSEPKRCVQSPEGQPLRKCLHCFAEKTPQWRAGPLGPKTLCNACGVRYKSGRLVPEYRPASSPTFSGDVHSNSHRKILEMRRSKQPFR